MDLDETRNISEGPRCILTPKIGGNHQNVSKTIAAFHPLILHLVRPFLKQKMWIGVHMHTLVKNYQIPVQGVFHAPKTAKNG